ncbi:MipA/OmpV family protein [Janthinobacterium sp. LB3P118]|uniref:MipA/OmpV family protein n=1 Tax=Janthinobacterium sp. LB3P118 TaxID=3424195 RepID=UPI003F201483
MNKLSPMLAILSLAALPAWADDGAVGMMPDGSTDMYVGLAVATRLSAGDDHESAMSLRPLLQVQGSNGIFVSGTGLVGMHLSQTPGVEYGPLLADSNGRDPGDRPRLVNTHPIRGSWDVGGFYNYYLGWQTRMLTSITYDTSAHGLVAGVGLQKTLVSVAPHHTISFSVGARLGSGAVMRERYEVIGAYRPSGGLMSLGAGVNWNWELNNRWLVNTAVSGQRLGNGPAGSPAVERRSAVVWSSGLAYRF